MEVCKYCAPDFIEVEPEHYCACHLYDSPERQAELGKVMEEQKRAEQAAEAGQK